MAIKEWCNYTKPPSSCSSQEIQSYAWNLVVQHLCSRVEFLPSSPLSVNCSLSKTKRFMRMSADIWICRYDISRMSFANPLLPGGDYLCLMPSCFCASFINYYKSCSFHSHYMPFISNDMWRLWVYSVLCLIHVLLQRVCTDDWWFIPNRNAMKFNPDLLTAL